MATNYRNQAFGLFYPEENVFPDGRKERKTAAGRRSFGSMVTVVGRVALPPNASPS